MAPVDGFMFDFEVACSRWSMLMGLGRVAVVSFRILCRGYCLLIVVYGILCCRVGCTRVFRSKGICTVTPYSNHCGRLFVIGVGVARKVVH